MHKINHFVKENGHQKKRKFRRTHIKILKYLRGSPKMAEE